jgi:hypothetical protein
MEGRRNKERKKKKKWKKGKKFVENGWMVDGDEGSTVMELYFVPLNWTLKNG